jgi:hypothetical protein
MVDLELEIVDRDFSIRVNGSVHSEAEDIFDGFVRGFDLKSSEERAFFFESFLEPEIGVSIRRLKMEKSVFRSMGPLRAFNRDFHMLSSRCIIGNTCNPWDNFCRRAPCGAVQF